MSENQIAFRTVRPDVGMISTLQYVTIHSTAHCHTGKSIIVSFGVWYDMRCMQELPLLSNKCLSRLKRNQFDASTWLEMICKAIQTCK